MAKPRVCMRCEREREEVGEGRGGERLGTMDIPPSVSGCSQETEMMKGLSLVPSKFCGTLGAEVRERRGRERKERGGRERGGRERRGEREEERRGEREKGEGVGK